MGDAVYPFSGRDQVQQEKPAAYLTSCAEWLTLVEKFGLAGQVESRDQGKQSPLDAQRRQAPGPQLTGSKRGDEWLASESPYAPPSDYGSPS
jgi:hypothetical protein